MSVSPTKTLVFSALTPLDPLERDLAWCDAVRDAAFAVVESAHDHATRCALARDIDATLRALRVSDAGRSRVTRGWHRRTVDQLRALSDAARELTSGVVIVAGVACWSPNRVNAPTKLLAYQQR